MDFIERLFNVSPDGGSGLTELLILALPVAACLAAFALRRPRHLLAPSPPSPQEFDTAPPGD
jgi:hypothetical protein